MDELKQQEFKGIIGFIKSLFTLNEISNDEFTMEERRKVPIYLQNSLKNLFEIFKINNVGTKLFVIYKICIFVLVVTKS